MFADGGVFTSGGCTKRSLRVANLNDCSLNLSNQNNDDVERIARRRSRLLEPHPEVVNSPVHDMARRTAATQFVPRAEVGEHYGNCIRLATENKITYKNAFNLHLIDFMGEMIKKEDFTSFRMACSSLDASAKIYAGRVDAVHQEAYKVLTGLGRSESKTEKAGDDKDTQAPGSLDDSNDELGGIDAINRRRKERRRAPNAKPVIVATLNKIRSSIKAFDGDMDPLFQQQAAAYDDGGTVELRLNCLLTHSENSELMQDSSTPLFSLQNETSPLTCCIQPIELYPVFDSQTLEAPLCLAFDNFNFNKLDDENRTHMAPLSPIFMEDACVSDGAIFTSTADVDDTALPMSNVSGDDPEVNLMKVGKARFVHMADAVDNQSVSDPAPEGELFVSSLKSMLTAHLENFGHVNDGVLGLWAGPEHWRKKSKRRRLDEFGNVAAPVESEANGATSVGKSSRAKYIKKNKANVDYATVLPNAGENRSKSGCIVRSDWSKQLEVCTKKRGKSVLREQNRRIAGQRFNLLPPSISDVRQNIYELFNREVMFNLVDKKTNETHENVTANAMADGNIVPPWLDSQAAAAAGENRRDNDADDMVQMAVDDDTDDELAPYDGIFTQIIEGPTGFNENLATLVPLEDKDGVDLVELPRQIARFEIGYARSAKLINVRHLKSILWSMIEYNLDSTCTHTFNIEELSPPSKKIRTLLEAEILPSSPPSSPSLSLFSHILTTLPSKVSRQTATELSVAIGLNCLLHLANEKDLFLETCTNCTDLSISHGLPATEIEGLSQYKRCSYRTNAPRSKKQPSLDSWLEKDTNIVDDT